MLIFSTMTRLLEILEDHLAWRGIDSLRLDGSTPSASRGALVRHSSEGVLAYTVVRTIPLLEHCCQSFSARHAFQRALQKPWRSHKHAPTFSFTLTLNCTPLSAMHIGRYAWSIGECAPGFLGETSAIAEVKALRYQIKVLLPYR